MVFMDVCRERVLEKLADQFPLSSSQANRTANASARNAKMMLASFMAFEVKVNEPLAAGGGGEAAARHSGPLVVEEVIPVRDIP